jgi:hypothetical protein
MPRLFLPLRHSWDLLAMHSGNLTGKSLVDLVIKLIAKSPFRRA